MSARRNDILQGTLALLVLQTLASGRKMHGYAITAHIQRISDQLLRVEEGSLYPALHRMEQDGWVRAEWGEDREEPGGAVLFNHSKGTAAARGRAAELAAAHGRGRSRAGGGAVMSWAGRIRNALRPERVGREIDRELAFHLAEKIEELQAAGLNEMEQF